MGWVVGYIENQTALIKACDVLIFHNHIPTERSVADGKTVWTLKGQKMVFEKILAAEPKAMCIFLSNFNNPKLVVKILESLNVKYEVVDKVDCAGHFETRAMRDEMAGKAIISTLHT